MKAREFSYQALCKICIDKTYSNLYLRKELDQVEKQDKALATSIVYGTLQNARYCRYQWECYAQKAPKEEVAILLDMSIYQLLFMDHLPQYAIVNEAVTIAKSKFGKKYGALVNALLHKVCDHEKRTLPQDEWKALAIETSHPYWIVMMWKAQYGEDACRKICYANNQKKKQCARVNEMKLTRDELLLKDPLFTKGDACDSCVYYDGDGLVHTTYYQEGVISIQDASSQMVAFMVDPQKGERILDVCSAPGTKACHMAERMQDEGEIICGDIHEHRVELIKQGANRLGLQSIDARVMDATCLEGLEEGSFDRVLCDVPCSGYGVLASKSDIKYHMQSEDMDTLIPLQAAILKKASMMVKDGGVLVYSTCTLNKKENEKQVEKFLKENENFTLLEQRTIFPYEYDGDGFFMAKLIKK